MQDERSLAHTHGDQRLPDTPAKPETPATPEGEKLSLWERITREREQLRRLVDVTRLGARGLYRSQLPRMAAALAYRTIFSIIPVFVISLLVLGSLVNDEQLEDGIKQLLVFSGLDQIALDDSGDVIEEGAPEPPPPDAEFTPSVLPEGADPVEIAASAQRLDSLISDLVQRVNTSIANIPGKSIAFISVVVLIYAALSMLVELERSFNQIFRASSGRPWLRRLILYWSMLTLGALLLAATFSVGDLFLNWATSLVGKSRAGAAALGFVVTVAISTLLLLIAYLSVPNTRVKLRPALGGAFVAAVLWELGKWGFRQYLDFSTGYSTFYGSLALLPLFLLWVYVTWLIVLFGLQVAYAMQNFGQWDELTERDSAPAIVDPASILLVASAVARRFASGKTAAPDDLAEEVGLPDALTARMLERLAAAGVVHVVEIGEDQAYALARPPELIPAADILAAGTPLAERSATDRGVILTDLARARERALEGKTLADVAGGPPRGPETGVQPDAPRSR